MFYANGGFMLQKIISEMLRYLLKYLVFSICFLDS